jgi:hypothetical protein
MVKQSTARNLMVFLTDSTDHVSGKTGATLSVSLSKNGAAFSSISPTVTERGNGWYNIALTSSHTDTLGDLVLRATASGADPIDLRELVVEAELLVNVMKMNSATVYGVGSSGDLWRGTP